MKFVENYAQIKAQSPISLRQAARELALDGLALLDRLAGGEKALTKPRVQFLYIHHIFKDEEQGLRSLLDFLAEHHTFISYSEALTRVLTGAIDRPYVAISSDDGFKNNLQAGQILKEFGVAACFFINPLLIGEKDKAVIERHCRQRLNLPPVEFLDWKDVEQMMKDGHEFGSHTMVHDNVATMSSEQFADDCRATKKIITERCGSAEHFAYPYGRFHHFNETARSIVFKAGFRSCASAERGCHSSRTSIAAEDLCIRRDHVILDWKLAHIKHFLIKSSSRSSSATNLFPYN